MSQTNSSEIKNRIIDGLKLSATFDNIPQDVARSIVPTFQTNIEVPIMTEIYKANSTGGARTYVVPQGKMWKVKTSYFTLVTSANAGDRVFSINIYNDVVGVPVFVSCASAVQTASTTNSYSTINNTNSYGNNTIYVLGFPDVWIPYGYSIRVYDNAGIHAAGDTIGGSLFVEEVNQTNLI